MIPLGAPASKAEAYPTPEGAPLVRNPDAIRLAMLGMVEGNGHPFSWSAIINGDYDPEAMASCGYPVIPQYLGAEPKGNLGIAGTQVTHVWCEDPADARRVAKAALIPHIVEKATDVIGQVDAVVIPTDIGAQHADRAAAFIEAGLPVLIDKPLTDNAADLRQFVAWQSRGRPILSTSCMRYASEFEAVRAMLTDRVGEPRLITMTTPKSWERYGIHAAEGVYPFLVPGGWISVANTGTEKSSIVHARHASGVEVVLAAISDMYGAFCKLGVYGTKGCLIAGFEDTFSAFKGQLEAFVRYLRTGRLPFPFEQTVELMKIIIAGTMSRQQHGRTILLEEIEAGPAASPRTRSEQ